MRFAKWSAGLSTLAILVLSVLLLRLPSTQDPSRQPVRISCASGMVDVLQQMLQLPELPVAAEVVRSGGSGELAGQWIMEFQSGFRTADVLILADDHFFQPVVEQEAVTKRTTLAWQTPVIAIADRIDADQTMTLQQVLQSPTLRIGVASPRAAIGRLTRQYAQSVGQSQRLDQRALMQTENVMTLAQALVSGSLDVAIVWDATVQQIERQSDRPGIRIAAPLDPEGQLRSQIAAGIAPEVGNPQAVQRLVDWLAHSPECQAILTGTGYRVVSKDKGQQHD